MIPATAEHHRTYTPRPFTRAERDSVTILFGGLHRRVDRVIQPVLEHVGYKARVLPIATKDDLRAGREVADIGRCCPTSFTTGNLVNLLCLWEKEEGLVSDNGFLCRLRSRSGAPIASRQSPTRC